MRIPQVEVEYPLTTSFERRLVVTLVVTLAIASSATALSHGALVASLGFGGLASTIVIGLCVFCVRQRVAFSEGSIHIPRTRWSANTIEVPFVEIEAVSLKRNRVSLTLILPNRKFIIQRLWLPSGQAFEDVERRLVQGMAAATIEKYGEGD